MSKYLVFSVDCVNFISKFFLNGWWFFFKVFKNIWLMCFILKIKIFMFLVFLVKVGKFYKIFVSGNILGVNVFKWKFWFCLFYEECEIVYVLCLLKLFDIGIIGKMFL